GVSVATTKLSALKDKPFAIVVVSTSWAPERVATAPLLAALRRWERSGSILGALDTGAFILADAGLLRGRRATVHYEHLGAFRELHDDLDVVDDIFVREEKLFTCSGGAASADAALHLIAAAKGMALASAAMHYIFHPQ